MIEAPRLPSRFALCLVLGVALRSGGLAADSATLEAAVNKYYAGQADAAMAMIEPLAAAGDAEAQYLFGNILYTLAQSGQTTSDPVKWYRLAAAQDSAPANYALGTLLQNRWLQSRLDEDADKAQTYLQRAAELGEPNAQVALDKLAAHRRSLAGSKSLTYTNDSFSSKRVAPENKTPVVKTPPVAERRLSKPVTTLDELLSRFESSGDPVADAQRLKRLLGQMDEQALSNSSSGSPGGLLGGFDSAEDLLGKLIELYGHIEAATELSTAPGAN